MADRIEREIEEILERLDSELPGGALPEDKKPISLMQRRQQATKKVSQPRAPRPNPLSSINPTTLLFAGAIMTVVGFILASMSGAFIWLSFAGVVLFLIAFAWSFTRRSTAGGSAGASPKAVYWRDRYIEYEPANTSAWGRLKRRFRR
jgi:hypothetical protein